MSFWPEERVKDLEKALRKILRLCKERIKFADTVDDETIIKIASEALRDDDSPQAESTFGVHKQCERADRG